jgi:D-glycerate 3-kinase
MTFAPETEQAQRDLAAWLAAVQRGAGRCLVAGINGAQGSGKTTWCRELERRLAGRHGVRAVTLALDDFYLTRAERERLAREVHPLFLTRGVPGTHDTELGRSVLARLRGGEGARLPRFEKARDDRAPEAEWGAWHGGADVVLFEGWCVGAVPQAPGALAVPCNDLERDEDPGGVWRGRVNAALAAEYADWFSGVDLLIQLDPGSWEAVHALRRDQEQALARELVRTGRPGRVMSDPELLRFLAHYERLTRWMLDEMCHRAAGRVRVEARRVVEVLLRPADEVAANLTTFRFPFDTGTGNAHLPSKPHLHGSC